jgi:hypothetical protein
LKGSFSLKVRQFFTSHDLVTYGDPNPRQANRLSGIGMELWGYFFKKNSHRISNADYRFDFSSQQSVCHLPRIHVATIAWCGPEAMDRVGKNSGGWRENGKLLSLIFLTWLEPHKQPAIMTSHLWVPTLIFQNVYTVQYYFRYTKYFYDIFFLPIKRQS